MVAPNKKRADSSHNAAALRTHAHASIVSKGKDFARSEMTRSFKGSAIADRVQEYPRFELSEVQLGKVLGRGGFGTVFEITNFFIDGVKVKPNKKPNSKARSSNEFDINLGDFSDSEGGGNESRLFIAEHCLRNNSDARYALKRLSPEVIASQDLFLQGAMDIALETRFLSDLEHPNIVKLRAISESDVFSDKYFLILDRLYDTLERRIQKTWLFKHKNQTSFLGKTLFDRKGKKKDALYEKRIVYAYDLAAAINYLHQRKIIYRDLKPGKYGIIIIYSI